MKWTIFAIMFFMALLGCWMIVLSAQAEIDGVVIINNNPVSTKMRVVNVLIPAADGGSGVQDMCLSVGTSCSTWQPYNKEASVYLGGEVGNWYSVCVKVRDNAGNESEQKCTQIQLTGE